MVEVLKLAGRNFELLNKQAVLNDYRFDFLIKEIKRMFLSIIVFVVVLVKYKEISKIISILWSRISVERQNLFIGLLGSLLISLFIFWLGKRYGERKKN